MQQNPSPSALVFQDLLSMNDINRNDMNDINIHCHSFVISTLSFNNFHRLHLGDLIDSPDPRYIELFHPDRALSELWNMKLVYFPNNWSFDQSDLLSHAPKFGATNRG